MVLSSVAVSVSLVVILSTLLVVSGIKRQPGIGILAGLVIIGAAVSFRPDGLGAIGFRTPESWPQTILLSLILGSVIQLFSVTLVEPLSDRITKHRHDHSIVESVKGNWKALLLWLVIVWLIVAFVEEIVYRGFLMTETANIVGMGGIGLLFSLILSSVIFGLSHWYQGPSGALSTGVIGFILGVLFVWSGYNLWLPILTHGFIDTVGIGLIAIGGDEYLRDMFWRKAAA